ncbi:MAG TPA: VWA domain-containing protein [Anaerolineales bacterium]|nr:VWA domain-containing protein [Anaerolineales bacterium]
MSFIWPSMLGSLLLVPLLVLIYIVMQQRRQNIVTQSGLGLVQSASSATGLRRHYPALIFLLGLTTLLFSLARPQATVSLPKYEGTVILVFDVSGSMAADDIAPTRMEAAKTIAADFVEGQPADVRIGVVAFSDGGLNVQAPDVNREETLATVERLVPRRGTSLGNGILVALNTIAVDAGDPPIINTSNLSTTDDVSTALQGWYPSAVIVLFSDGENNDPPDPLTVTDLAIDLGVHIYTIGVGSAEGTTIKVEGMNIHTQLNEPLLAQIAGTSGGQYYFAGDKTELRKIYNELEPTLSIKPEELELTSSLAGLSILVFLAGGALSLLWFGRVV